MSLEVGIGYDPGGASVKDSFPLTEDPDPFVRYEALVSLARIRGERARGPLLLALDDPEQIVLAEAEEILESQVRGSSAQ
jgi:HEAT repeat protein